MSELFSNNAATTLGSALSATATTITVATGTGNTFPAIGAGQYFTATLWAAGSGTGVPNEIVRVTARTGDTMTVLRGQEGTTPQAWGVGDTFANYPTAAFYNGLGGDVPNSGLSQMPADTVKANLNTSADHPQDVTLAALKAALGQPTNVTNDELANMPGNTVKANLNPGATAPQDVTLAALTAALGVPTLVASNYSPSSWYRIWSDGFIEQGLNLAPFTPGSRSFSWPVAFTSYISTINVSLSSIGVSASGSESGYTQPRPSLTGGIAWTNNGGNSAIGLELEARGK